MGERVHATEEGQVKKSTVHQLVILTVGGVIALTLYEFLVQPAVSKVVSGPPKRQLP
jgi:hypothetical protein